MNFKQNLRWSGGQALMILAGWLLIKDWGSLSMMVFLLGLLLAYHSDNLLAKVLREPVKSRMQVSKLTIVTSVFAWQLFTAQALFWPTNWIATNICIGLWLITTVSKWLLDVKYPVLVR
jgi:hypothetical protein